MSHTGIRLRVDLPGAGTILLGDSDFLHMMALMRGLDQKPDMLDVLLAKPGQSFEPGQGWVQTGDGSVGPWHQWMTGAIEIWIQPVMLPDAHLDDEGQDGDGLAT